MPSKKLGMMTAKDKIAYNCKKATFLIEKSAAGKISNTEIKELMFHLEGCTACRLYEKQSYAINKLTSYFFTRKANSLKLSMASKKNIQLVLERKLQQLT